MVTGTVSATATTGLVNIFAQSAAGTTTFWRLSPPAARNVAARNVTLGSNSSVTTSGAVTAGSGTAGRGGSR